MPHLVEVRIDSKGHVERMPEYTGQRRLEAIVLDKPEWVWFEGEKPEQFDYVYLALFEIPSAAIPSSIDKTLREMRGKVVDMGDLPHLREYNIVHLDVELKEGNVYDIYTMAVRNRVAVPLHVSRFVAEGRKKIIKERLIQVSKKPSRYRREQYAEIIPPQVAYNDTFEEIKFKAIGSLGLIPQDAQGVRAKVFYAPEYRPWYVSAFAPPGIKFINDVSFRPASC